MHALVLLQQAVVDTVAAVKNVQGIVDALAGWLPEGFRAWLTTILLGAPITLMVFSWEFVGKLIGQFSPFLKQYVLAHFERFGFILNPILAALFAGGIFHNPLIGLGAGAVWGIINSALKSFGKSTPAGLLKAKVAALVVGSLVALSLAAGPSSAATAKEHYSLLSHLSFSPGVGYRWEKSLGNAYAVPYWDVRAGYSLFDHLKLEGRLGHNLGPVEGGVAFYEARLGLVF